MSNDSASREPLRVAVIGGGISGLAAAHRLIELARETNRPLHLSLYEAADRLGGVAETLRIGEYLVESGPDMFITNQPAAVQLCERLGLSDQLIPTDTTHRGSLVLCKGRPVRVPDGFMLLSPAKIWPVLTSPIFSPLGKLRMGLELLLPRKRGDDDESLASFVRRRFGTEALERLIQPLVGGIYTADPEKLSLKATMSRFIDMEVQHRSLILASRRQAASDAKKPEFEGSGARYGLFTTLRDGLSVLFERLQSVIAPECDLRLGKGVSSVSLNDDGTAKVIATDGTSDVFDRVLLANRAPRAADILDAGSSAATSSEVGQLVNLLRQIHYASTAIVVSGHRLDDIEHPLDAFGLVIPEIERRRLLAVSFTSRKFPGRAPDGHILLRTFVGGAMQPELLDRSDNEILSIVREELGSILGVRGEPDFARVCRYSNAMPQYHIGHCERVAEIDKLAARIPQIELAGNAFTGVGIPDCIKSGEAAAERILHGC
jgi:oxygen-dependent protoporphyrinogen oxidase